MQCMKVLLRRQMPCETICMRLHVETEMRLPEIDILQY